MISNTNLNNKRVPILDCLRAIAVLLVIWAHMVHLPNMGGWYINNKYIFPSGEFGVRVFFVISGFIITFLLLKEFNSTGAVSLNNFYRRRFLRIVPAFFVFLCAVFFLDAFTTYDEPMLSWLTSVTFTKNFYMPTWTTGHLWSLSVEEQFYIFWPLLLIAFKNKTLTKVALLIIFMALVSRFVLILLGREGFANTSLFTNSDFLMSGALLALVYFNGVWANIHYMVWRVLAASFILLTLLIEHSINPASNGLMTATVAPTLLALTMSLSLLSLLRSESDWLISITSFRPIVYIGKISYSLYLWQQLFLVTEKYYGADLPLILHFPGALLCCFLVAILSYEFVEKPFLKYRVR